MSYDLNFVSKVKQENVLNTVKDYLTSIMNIKTNNYNQFIYENEDTGVYFSIDFNDNDDEESTDDLGLKGFYNTGISLNLNYMRPSFFAYEAMPFVEKLAKSMDWYTIDPQNHDTDEPRKYEASELINSWKKSNEWATKVYVEQGATPLKMNHDVATNLWKYLYEKSNLQNRLGDNYFVPKLFVSKIKGEDCLKTAITWSQGIPQIFPKCDFIIILKKRKSLFGIKEENGYISYDLALDLFGDYLETFQGPIDSLKILHPGKSELIQSKFMKMKLNPFEDIELIRNDNFIDF